MNTNRLIELEIKIAYQDDLVQSLNKIVAEQQQQIVRLERTCKLMNERIQSLANGSGVDDSNDQIPPHY
jgi:SlyX protein